MSKDQTRAGIRILAPLILMMALLLSCSGGGEGVSSGKGADSGGEAAGGTPEATASEDSTGGGRAAGDGDGRANGGDRARSFTVAEQYGLAYAPLQIMRRRGMFSERLEREGLGSTEVDWVRLGNTAAIREAILGGRVDAGFMGIPPFLIGYDRGMEWRIAVGLSRAPLGLVTWREDIRSLEDFDENDRIALPQPGSIQHILLSMACERELGQADALDELLVTMNHPDGMQALLGEREISAHFTSPPYVMEELARPGMRRILSGREAMGGDFTFIVGTITDRALGEMPEVSALFVESVREAAEWTEAHPEEAARLLNEEYGIDQEKLVEYLRHEELEYGPEILGVEQFIDFMHRHGYLRNRLDPEEVVTSVGTVQR